MSIHPPDTYDGYIQLEAMWNQSADFEKYSFICARMQQIQIARSWHYNQFHTARRGYNY